jgi:putative transposase
MMRRSFRFRLRPTRGQQQRLTAMLAAHCDLYNAALQERRDAWRRDGRSISLFAQSADLPWIRAHVPGQKEWSARSQQETLRRLDRAFQAFFRRVASGETAGYPRFKSVRRWDSVTHYEQNGARWFPDAGRVAVVGIGHIRVHAHRPTRGRVKTITLRREGRRWFVILGCDQIPKQPLPDTGRRAGVDVGVVNLAATSDGVLFVNPRYAQASADKLARLQRAHQVGGRRSVKLQRAVGELHRKIRRQRRDLHHKIARGLVERYDVIAVEQLRVANLVRRPRPQRDPDDPLIYLPNGGAAKGAPNRSIQDAGWAQFLGILDAKAEEAGRRVIRVPAHHTSQTCSQCGHVDAESRVTQAAFDCRACGHRLHADVNAAINILQRGLALLPAADTA